MAGDPNEEAHPSELDTAADRRRPGRQDVSPELIPLLRGSAAVGVSLPDDQDDYNEPDFLLSEPHRSDPLSFVHGLKWAILVSAVAWLLLGLLVRARF
jgi:hypothetical protein